jgi:hypothetical protein
MEVPLYLPCMHPPYNGEYVTCNRCLVTPFVKSTGLSGEVCVVPSSSLFSCSLKSLESRLSYASQLPEFIDFK